MPEIVPQEVIETKIFWVRGKKVMLDKDLAELYGVATRDLNKAVNRNLDRFPEDFMFQLNRQEFQDLMFHFGTSRWGGTRKLPHAFTEHGILMLSSILKSRRAVHVNIQIMRIFVKLRKILESHKKLLRKIEEMEKKYDYQFKVVFEIIKNFIKEEEKPRRRIGFCGD